VLAKVELTPCTELLLLGHPGLGLLSGDRVRPTTNVAMLGISAGQSVWRSNSHVANGCACMRRVVIAVDAVEQRRIRHVGDELPESLA
jgi:hypothetical protein